MRVGLVNNMPDGAFEATEAQFGALIDAACGGATIVRLSLSGIYRGEVAAARIAADYLPAVRLPSLALDALIVTGCEPRAADLRDEPFWLPMTRLIDAAKAARVPTLFSCLAAHAAVLHLDGIVRRRLPEKRFGVFAHRVDPGHRLMTGLEGILPLPSSRWNDLDPAALRSHGYQMVGMSAPHAEIFLRHDPMPMLFLQGHPEYDRRSLPGEYLRDLRRFYAGSGPRPQPPRNCFSRAVLAALHAAENDAGAPAETQLAVIAAILRAARPAHAWASPAVTLFANWLALAEAARAGRERVAA